MERVSLAPMMEITDAPFRWIARRLAPSVRLYTEMVTTHALDHGDAERFLAFDGSEHPVALQLGGDDPEALRRWAVRAESLGYDEVNLNVGCPSARVASGNFGVCLMGQPERVADAVGAMRAAVRIPVTVKHRIGFDDRDAYEDMLAFVDAVADAGCQHFVVHARKAWLKGLSPKDNRTVPPLRHEEVARLKRERSSLWVATNGGIRDLDAVRRHLTGPDAVDGVMVGRWFAEEPAALSVVEREILGGEPAVESRRALAEATLVQAERAAARGASAVAWVRHLIPLLHGLSGARAWRRGLSSGDRGVASLRALLADPRLCEVLDARL